MLIETRKKILLKGYTASILLLLLSLGIVFKIFELQLFESSLYQKYIQSSTIRESTIIAKRGNLYSDNGNLMATSITLYDIYLDPFTISETLFNEEISALSDSLESLFFKPSYYFERKITIAKKNNVQYMLLTKGLSHVNFNRIKKFPILREGQNKGGFIVEHRTVRTNTVKEIAGRAIGFDDNRGKAGLEGAFSIYLRGVNGLRKEQRITAKDWKPMNIWNEKEPIDGMDVFSTINLYIQNITYSILLKQLKEYEADHGCIVVMEVKTGEIKALVNLQKTKDNSYKDVRNFAIWEANEPGSTFKTMSLMAAMENGYVNSNSVINVENGKYKLYGRTISDDHFSKKDLTVSQILEESSNIGTAKIINTNYKEDPSEFIDQLKKWGLDKKIDLQIPGESSPKIPSPDDENWNKFSLASMSYGYSLKLTPLQIITFYNAIGNNGIMVKPLLVKKVIKSATEVKEFSSEIINKKIASDTVIKEMQKMLANVFIKGTAKELKLDQIPLAGKTGTTRAEYWLKGPKQYRASIVGYFPANEPKYSCIVIISKPNTKKGYYGNKVAGNAFKEIASSLSNIIPKPIADSIKAMKRKNFFVKSESFNFKNFPYMENTKGFYIKEVVPVLENMGLKVTYSGVGRIKHQSISMGQKIYKGATINIIAE